MGFEPPSFLGGDQTLSDYTRDEKFYFDRGFTFGALLIVRQISHPVI